MMSSDLEKERDRSVVKALLFDSYPKSVSFLKKKKKKTSAASSLIKCGTIILFKGPVLCKIHNSDVF